MEKSKRLIAFDILKLAMAFLVVCIHFNTFIPRDIIVPIARIAVPVFFVATGFFVAGAKDQLLAKAKRLVITAVKYLLVAMVIYFVYDLIAALVNGTSLTLLFDKLLYENFIIDFFVYSLPNTSGYQLWYLSAFVVAALVHLLLCKLKLTKAYYLLVPLLLIANLVLGEYASLLGIDILPAYTTRNALLTGVPFLGIGFLIKQNQLLIKDKWKYALLAAGLIFAGLQALEMHLIDPNGLSDGRVYITTIFAVVCLFVFAASVELRSEKFYHYIDIRLCFTIYLFHVLVGRALGAISPSIQYALLIYVICFVVLGAACMLERYLVKKIKAKRGLEQPKEPTE